MMQSFQAESNKGTGMEGCLLLWHHQLIALLHGTESTACEVEQVMQASKEATIDAHHATE
jgi:hypothetical protein